MPKKSLTQVLANIRNEFIERYPEDREQIINIAEHTRKVFARLFETKPEGTEFRPLGAKGLGWIQESIKRYFDSQVIKEDLTEEYRTAINLLCYQWADPGLDMIEWGKVDNALPEAPEVDPVLQEAKNKMQFVQRLMQEAMQKEGDERTDFIARKVIPAAQKAIEFMEDHRHVNIPKMRELLGEMHNEIAYVYYQGGMTEAAIGYAMPHTKDDHYWRAIYCRDAQQNDEALESIDNAILRAEEELGIEEGGSPGVYLNTREVKLSEEQKTFLKQCFDLQVLLKAGQEDYEGAIEANTNAKLALEHRADRENDQFQAEMAKNLGDQGFLYMKLAKAKKGNTEAIEEEKRRYLNWAKECLTKVLQDYESRNPKHHAHIGETYMELAKVIEGDYTDEQGRTERKVEMIRQALNHFEEAITTITGISELQLSSALLAKTDLNLPQETPEELSAWFSFVAKGYGELGLNLQAGIAAFYTAQECEKWGTYCVRHYQDALMLLGSLHSKFKRLEDKGEGAKKEVKWITEPMSRSQKKLMKNIKRSANDRIAAVGTKPEDGLLGAARRLFQRG